MKDTGAKAPSRTPRVGDIAALLDDMAPPALAEDWDNCGLLVGDPGAAPRWVAVALDAAHALAAVSHPYSGARADGAATGAGVGALRAGGPGLLVVHHPVPFRPTGRLLETEPTGGIVLDLARRGWSLYAAHTSFDTAPLGLSHVLAVTLGLEPGSLRPLGGDTGPGPAGGRFAKGSAGGPLAKGPASSPFFKLVVFVPTSHTAAVRAALAEAGAGWIGNYSDTAFAAPGHGYFRPREGANPFLGTAGEVEEAAEDRLETIVPAYRLDEVVARMREAHPYEEVAYDVYPLASHPAVTRPELLTGIGRVGELASGEARLRDFRAAVERALGLPPGGARLAGNAGDSERPVRRVAVCPGAGGGFVGRAAAAGADVFVTGDLTYHQVLEAAQLGLALIDAGHLATERAFVGVVADRLRKSLASQGIQLDVIEVPTPSGWLL